jgi:hypothetical protein
VEEESSDTAVATTTTPVYPTLAGEVGLLMATRCEGCHNVAVAEGGLDLQTDMLAVTLGMASTQALEMELIANRDHLQSYLWHKVNGTHAIAGGSGSNMPLGGELSPQEIELLAYWIDIGCP